jgi:hypothetical protein
MSERENVRGVEEHELVELFRPRRPDPDAFRAGVARKLAEREGAPKPELEQRSTFLRRVAAFAPPEFAAALGAGKGISAVLALPALMLAASLGAFVGGVRSLTRSSREAVPPLDSAARPMLTNRHAVVGAMLVQCVQVATLFVFFLPTFLGGRSVDLILAALIVSMFALTLSVRGLARVGALDRGQVARMSVGLLSAVLCGCFLWASSLQLIDAGSDLGLGWSAAILLGGIVLSSVVLAFCLPERRTSWPIALVIGVPFAFWIALAVWVLPFGATRSTPDDLRRWLVEFEADATQLGGWRQAAATYEALRAIGEEPGDLAHIRESVERAIDDGVDAHPQVWTTAARMGLVDDEHWRVLAARRLEVFALDNLLRDAGNMHAMSHGEYRFHMLVATRELDDAARRKLVERIGASWPKESNALTLDNTLLCVRLFDLVGATEQVEARRGAIRELVRRHWIGERGGELFTTVGGFTSDPAKFRTSFEESTWTAVKLMSRVGVPEGVDLRLLRAHLRHQCSRFVTLGSATLSLDVEHRAALVLLERVIGLPERPWFERLVGERVQLGTLAIVALCFVAMFLAPRRGIPGALP